MSASARPRAPRSVATRRGTKGSCAGPAPSRRQASVSTMRLRMRSRSSAVAALVKVTTRMLLHVEPAFEQQPQVQAAQVPGLAGAGRGLDQADAVERAVEDVEFRRMAVRVIGSTRTAVRAMASREQQRVEHGVRAGVEFGEACTQRVGPAAQRQADRCVGVFAERAVLRRAPGAGRGGQAAAVSSRTSTPSSRRSTAARASPVRRGRAGRAARRAAVRRARSAKRASRACQVVRSATPAGGSAHSSRWCSQASSRSLGARLVVAVAHEAAGAQVGEAGVHAPGPAAEHRARSTPSAAAAPARASARAVAWRRPAARRARGRARCARRRLRAARCRRARARERWRGRRRRAAPAAAARRAHCAPARRAGRARRPAVPRRSRASSMPSRLPQQEAAGVAKELHQAIDRHVAPLVAGRGERRAEEGLRRLGGALVVVGLEILVRDVHGRVEPGRRRDAGVAAPARIRDGSCAGAGRRRA